MSRWAGVDYAPFLADFYDHLPIVTGRADLDFYLDFGRRAGGPILELGCGTGRVLIPIAAAGCRIVGLDHSEQMLNRCRAKLANQSPEVQERVRLVQASMTDFDLGETFRLITTPFRSFQHLLSIDDQLGCLHCAHHHLCEGGKLILDLFYTDPRRMHDPAYTQESASYPEVELPDGRKVRMADRIAAFHRAAQCNDVEMIYYVTHADGRTERLAQTFSMRYFFRYEVEHLLARSGFRVVAEFGNFDQSLLADDSPEMIFVAEKPEDILAG